MKKIFTFCVSLLAALSVFAYDFQSGDLFYNITSSSAPYTVEVTQQSQAYYSNYSGVDTIVIPETVTYNAIIYSVTSIGESAFNHSKLTTITIPNSVTSIGDQAFQYCTYLKDVTIGNRVESIGTAAFNNCSSLRSIIIPQSVKYIYNYAFVGASLNSIYVNRTIPPTLNPEREDPYMVLGTGMVDVCYIPCGKLASYQISEWKTKGQVREFVERPSYLLTVQSVDKTMGTATITQDINCETQIATIAATPYDGYRFVQWSDGNTDNPRSLTITTDTTLIAEFEKDAVDPTWQIYYTSTDSNIVTPYKTNVFGANIVSNEYKDGQGVITFDGPVMSIGDSAFYKCSGMALITIPNSVASIGDAAFSFCHSLTSITIPESVTSIGDYAFADCSSLTSVTIPNSVTSIGINALGGCDSLTSIVVEDGNATYDSRENCNAIIKTATNTLIAGCQNTIIPNSVTSIGESAFWGCDSLISFTIPNSVKNIKGRAFFGCHSLTSISIPNSVISIGEHAFTGCTSLTSITIPNSVTNIEQQAFWYCTSLTSIAVEPNNLTYDSRENCNALIETSTNTLITGCQNTFIPNSVTSIGDYAFYGCKGLISITIPSNVTSIGNHAFDRCTNLTSITIPNSVTNIGEHAFVSCYSLTSMTIPSSTTEIKDYAYYCCSGLTSITIPSSVNNIGIHAFSHCTGLTTIICKATTPPNLGYAAFYNIPKSTTLIIPCGTKAAYEASDWKNYVSEFVENCVDPTWQITYTSTDGNIVTPYRTNVFGANIVSNTYENGVGTITFDGPVTSIGEEAFHSRTSLTSITIPNSVTSIGSSAFDYCSALTSITIPNSVTSIGGLAFRYCTSLTSITIPNSVTNIDVSVFNSCSSLTSIVVEGGNTTYDSHNNCNAIIETATNTLIAGCQNTIIPNSVTSIGDYAFYGCTSLTAITIPNSVTSIGDHAFSECTSLSSVTIPNSVASIGEYAFYRCLSLASVTIPDSVTSIGWSAFCYCSALTSVTIGNNVAIIDWYAFYNCSSLTSITIPNSVTSIKNQAFQGCSSLTSVTIGNNVTLIANLAFFECSSLDTLRILATTPPTLRDEVFSRTPSPICYIPCGTKSAYEASDWASQVDSFEEEGCPVIQMCGDNLYWEYADGVLTITGTGDMYDYAADTDVPWYDVRGNIKTVSLPDAMTKIGQNAFYKCTAMTSINMPTSLTAIGEKAFAQDTKLTGELTLPASLTTIDERAFFNCKAVTAFHIEATTPPTLQDKAFDYVVSPIHVPCGYGHIYGKHTQWGMLNLEMCELLQDNVYYYPIDGHTARAVTYHSNPTDTIVIPSAVVIDGVLRTVTEVADFAFTDCDNLPAIYFNEGLEHIGERAFVRCYGLKGTITLPTTLTTIGERAFSYCDNVEKYLLQAMTPPVLGEDVFTGNNKNALFYISCEAMDDYKVATNWSSLKSRLRDACLNIYHYNTTPLGTNGVYTTEDTLVASIYYRRRFTPYRWETLYLPFEVDRVTVLEDGVEYDLTAWDIVNGGHYFLAKPDGMLNKEILFGFTDELESHTPYIIQFSDAYYTDKLITFYGKESWNKLSTSFEVLSSSAWMQIAGNTTLQDQLLEKPVYMLRSGLDFILQKTTTTLHPFECYVMPYTVQSGAPARMSVRLRDDVATAVESMRGNESRLAYTINGNTLTVYPQGQAFSIYSLNGALIYSCEAGKEAVDCELNSGCYLLHAGTEAHKIML